MSNITHKITAAGLALGFLAPMAAADARSDKATWGAAAAIAGVGAVVEATKDRPGNAAALAAGAALAYRQYDKASGRAREDRFAAYPVSQGRWDDRDAYPGNSSYNRPGMRPGAGRGAAGDHRDRPNARYNSRTRQVSGVVTSTPGPFKRELKARLDNGQTRTISVPREARVRRDGRDISVHDVRKDDIVRVEIDRFTNSGTLKAHRLDVLGRGGWSSPAVRDVRLQGSVADVNARDATLRLNADGRRLTVYTDRADIVDRGRRLDLRDLRKGERVTVEGRRDGDRIFATRISTR